MSVLDDIEYLRPLWEGNVKEESDTIIRIDQELSSLTEEELEGIFTLVNSETEYFDTFEVNAHFEDRPKKSLIIERGGLEKPEDAFEGLGDSIDEDVDRLSRLVTELIIDEEFGGLSEKLIEWTQAWEAGLRIEAIISKAAIAQDIHQEFDGADIPIELFAWSNQTRLQEWIDNHPYQEIANTFFSEKSPIFVLFDDPEDPWLDSPIQKYSAEAFLEFDVGDVREQAETYQSSWRDNEDFAQAGPGLPIVSPTIFEHEKCQELFNVVFVYSVFISVTEKARLTDGVLELSIETRRSSIHETYTDEELSEFAGGLDGDRLEDLFEFYNRFSKRVKQEGDVFFQLWHRSIVEECDSFEELATKKEAIINNYEFLEQEAIEANFDDLSDAIQDTHTFTAEVTGNVSESTRSLTTEIQKVVLTLLGAVFANLFLVLRWSNVSMILPFSIGVIAGILGIYFPTIQTRIDELKKLVNESDEDFGAYTEMVRDSSESLFDFSEFEDRIEKYENHAEERYEWAVRNLRWMFLGLVTLWTAFAVISVALFDTFSRQYIVAVLSIFPALLIWGYHRDTGYYPDSFLIERGLDPLLLLVVIIFLTVVVDFFFTIPDPQTAADSLNNTSEMFV